MAAPKLTIVPTPNTADTTMGHAFANATLKPLAATAVVAPVPVAAPLMRRSIAEIRAARLSALAIKVEVSPEVTEAIGLLAEERSYLDGAIREIRATVAELESGIGLNIGGLDDATLRRQIKAQERLLQQNLLALEQNKLDTNSTMEDNGTGIALALIARGKLRTKVHQLLEDFRKGPTTPINITRLIGEVHRLNVVTHGESEVNFNWSGQQWVSAIAGDPSAVGFIPHMDEIIRTLQAEKDRLREGASDWLTEKHLLPIDQKTSLSALLDGAVGYALVEVGGLNGKTMGTIVVESTDHGPMMTKAIARNLLLVDWVFLNNEGRRTRRPVRLKKNTFDHPNPSIREALKAKLDDEAPIRQAMEAGKATTAELETFAKEHASERVHTLTLTNFASLLKATTAGGGHWLIQASWKAATDPKGTPWIPFGVVLKKEGKGKITLAHLTSAAPDSLRAKALDGTYSVKDLPHDIRAMIRTALYTLGMKAGFPPEIAKPTS